MPRTVTDKTATLFALSMNRRPLLCHAALCLLLWSIVQSPVTIAADTAFAFRPVTAGYRFQFPRDHGAHPDFRTEWWYYTGHLATAEGRRFGFELTFFRRAIPPADVKTRPSRWSLNQLYLAHFAVTDIAMQRFHFSEKLSREGLGKAGADESGLHVWIDDWRADADARGAQTLIARDGACAVSLTLRPAKPIVVHGKDGTSRKGSEPGQASHYYSFTRLATTGTVTIGNESFAVAGTSWMDHEFGSTDLSKDLVGWDWFSVQLDDQTELMLYRLRRADGAVDAVSSGTAVSPDGRTRHLSAADVEVQTTGTWTSPASKAGYPSRWRVTIPSLALSLEVVPLVTDQELRTSRSTQVVYWEGAVSITGTSQGRPVTGQGYVELTGYAERLTQKLSRE
jgi:predicted secreted hydrolase